MVTKIVHDDSRRAQTLIEVEAGKLCDFIDNEILQQYKSDKTAMSIKNEKGKYVITDITEKSFTLSPLQ